VSERRTTTARARQAIAITLAVAAATIAPAAGADELSADEIMRRNFGVGKVRDSRAEITMVLTNAGGTRRERSTIGFTKLSANGIDQKRLVRFLTPAEVKGTATLLIEHSDGDDDIWIYLPALRKVRRLVANNKKDSFVGTDFSYGDVIGHKVEEWTHQLVGKESIDGVDTFVVESVPRTDAVRDTSGYGKRKTWLRQDNFVAIKGQYWDTAGALVKESTARDVRELDPASHKWQAFTISMRNVQTGHSTEISWGKVEVGIGLGDDVFTERTLEKES
jgi:uncharacterized protein